MSYIQLKPPPQKKSEKLVRVTVHFVELSKDYNKVFSFKPADIVKQLNLLRPIYSKSTNYGHFGKINDKDITWEIANKADALRKAAK